MKARMVRWDKVDKQLKSKRRPFSWVRECEAEGGVRGLRRGRGGRLSLASESFRLREQRVVAE